jgi:acyl dehydratase
VGFDELRLKSALRGGDTVYVTSEITVLAPSKSGKDRGTGITRYEMIKQSGEVVVTFDSINLIYTRSARSTS